MAISRAAAAENPSRAYQLALTLAAAIRPMSMRLRMQTAIIIARLRSKAAQALHPVRNLFPRRLLRHRRILYRLPPKRWQAHFLKLRLQELASSQTPREKQPYHPAPDAHRAMWQRQRTMQHPLQEKQRQARRIITQELRSPARAARLRRIRSRNRPYIPSRNPIRAAARRCRITAELF